MSQKNKNNKSQCHYKRSEAININKSSSNETIDEILKYEDPSIRDILTVLKEIHSSQQFMAVKYDELITRHLELQNVCSSLTKQNEILKTEIKELTKDIRYIENHANEKKIEVQGIPKIQNENLEQIIIKIGAAFNEEIKKEDIDEIYRKENKGNVKKNYPIIVTFTKKNIKEKFLSMRKKKSIYTNEISLCESRHQIFINDFLTKRIKDLFWKTKNLKLEKGYKFLWTRNGTVYLRKTENSEPIKISCEEDLEKVYKNL